MAKNKHWITILSNELAKRKEKYRHFEFKFERVNDFRKKAIF